MIGLQLRDQIGLSLSRRPVCRIVKLLASKEYISGEDVNLALKDYYKKHPENSLAERVEDLYAPAKVDTPNRAVAYWVRCVNQNGIKIASLCLEEQVSESNIDALEASLMVMSNILKLYKDTKPFLAQRAETESGKNALEKANDIYEIIKSSFIANHAYLKEVFPDNNFYISSVDEILRQSEHD